MMGGIIRCYHAPSLASIAQQHLHDTVTGLESVDKRLTMDWSKWHPYQRVRSAVTVLMVFVIIAVIISACAPQDDEQRISQAVAETIEAQSRIELANTATVTVQRPTATTNPTPTPLPPPPQVVSDSMVAVTECVVDRMAGTLSRPRSHEFHGLPYLSDLHTPGAIPTREDLLDYQQVYLNDILSSIGAGCGSSVYSSEYLTEQQHSEMLEASKATSSMMQTGLNSPDMKHNCEEWEQSRYINYRSLRSGSVSRRGEESGLNFDYAWGKVRERISDSCAPYFSNIPTPDR